MSEVLSLAVRHPGGARPALAGFRSSHWGPSVQHSDDLGPDLGRAPRGGRSASPRTRTPRSRPPGSWRPTPTTTDVVWAGTEPQGLWRSDGRRRDVRAQPGLWDHPHRPEWGEGSGGGAIHTVLPDPADPQSMLVAMSTGGVYNSRDGGSTWNPGNNGIHAYFMPRPVPRVRPVRAQGGQRRGHACPALRPEPPRRLPLGRRRCHLAVHRRGPADGLRHHRGDPPAAGRHALARPDRLRLPSASRPARSCRCSTRTDAGSSWRTQAAGCRSRPTPTCCAMPPAWTPTSRPASTSAPAMARCTPPPTRARRSPAPRPAARRALRAGADAAMTAARCGSSCRVCCGTWPTARPSSGRAAPRRLAGRGARPPRAVAALADAGAGRAR